MIFTRPKIFSLPLLLFIALSCGKDSSSDIQEIDRTIMVSTIADGQIIDEASKINVTINSAGSLVEVFVDSQSIYSSQNTHDISIDFNPESYTTGSHVLKIVLTETNGKTITKEVKFEVHRRLIAINLPENMVNQYIINAVAFASKMDGSLIMAKRFNNADDIITLSSAEEFGVDEEFMLTFVLTDNGYATNLFTHANLTRNNIGTINLKKPFRGGEGEVKTYPAVGFADNELITSDNTHEPSRSYYGVSLNAAEETFTVFHRNGIDGDTNNPEIFYMYGYNNSGMFNNYQYLTLYPTLPDNFILDKANFSTAGLESKSVILNSPQNFDNSRAFMNIYGYWNSNDFEINTFHLIYNMSQTVSTGDQLNYALNTNFYDYRYWITFGNFYAAGIGIPKEVFTIPDNTLDFEYADNTVDLIITGTNHILGRIRLFDLDKVPTNQNYLWDITFNSKTTQRIVIPQLPDEVKSSNLLDLYEGNLMKVSSTELVAYKGINDYDEYLQKVIKDHKDPLLVTEGQELIYKGNGPFHDGPIRDFFFQ